MHCDSPPGPPAWIGGACPFVDLTLAWTCLRKAKMRLHPKVADQTAIQRLRLSERRSPGLGGTVRGRLWRLSVAAWAGDGDDCRGRQWHPGEVRQNAPEGAAAALAAGHVAALAVGLLMALPGQLLGDGRAPGGADNTAPSRPRHERRGVKPGRERQHHRLEQQGPDDDEGDQIPFFAQPAHPGIGRLRGTGLSKPTIGQNVSPKTHEPWYRTVFRTAPGPSPGLGEGRRCSPFTTAARAS
jgi:hypothetical protein